ncbi:MAG: TPM domain-containing protein [Candidatus Andersenbacteria bacterium]|nr:TPM domain-containing protein [Candidatus Andersenbacteria bacterium]
MQKLFLTVTLLLSGASITHAQQYPKATGYVNDFAQLLSSEQRIELNDALASFEKETSIEIAVVTVPWLNNQSVDEYAKGIGKEWGVGKSGQNNGIVFLIAPKERKMRIEVASGIRSMLTDSRADQIRDLAVLPHFKSGNMAQGVLGGAHAIMNALNTTSEQPSPASSEQSYDSTTGLWIGVGVAVVVLILIVALVVTNRFENRRYILEKRGVITNRFSQALETAKNPEIKEKTRTDLNGLAERLSSINEVTPKSRGVAWSKLREELESVNFLLGSAERKIKQEIAFAKKAREEGPELFNRIPGMIEEAEGRLANSTSAKAAQHLKDARAKYDQARTQYSGLSTTDWIILYVLLSEIESSVNRAAATNHQAESSDHSSHSDQPSNSSLGFGDASGFGGGGGFDGGGSLGSW